VDALARSVTAKQFIEVMAFAELEPFGELRADYRAASIRETVFNMAVSTKDRKPLDDFLLHFGDSSPKKKQQSPDQMAAMIKAWALAHVEG
jgi:hypothetical protein